MLGTGKRLIARRLVSVIVALVIVGAVMGATLDADPGPTRRGSARLTPASRTATTISAPSAASGPASGSCGPASATTIANVDATVAQGIFAGETHSSEVNADVARITGFQALLSALASDNEAAVYAAVHTIVYTPHWHIVRLRVVKAGHVLADVGGPDVIAPVSGALRWKGRTVGTYVMSVQDDVGYVKLVSRFIGIPVDLYRNGSFLMGTLASAPSKLRPGSSVHVGGTSYEVHLFERRRFPQWHTRRRAVRSHSLAHAVRRELSVRAARCVGQHRDAHCRPAEPTAGAL